MNIFKKEGIIYDLFNRLKVRDFSGNTGLAIKNSFFQFLTNITSKLGSLLFTVIIARLLMPELFGLYSLALSTVLLFAAISDFGIGSTIIKFISKEIGRKSLKKAKAYALHLWKLKLIFMSILIGILIISAKYISDTFYQKPIFLALIAGTLYILFYGLLNLMQATLQSFNKFRSLLYSEAIFQISRVIFVSLAVFISLKLALSDNVILFYLFLGLALAYLVVVLFLWFFPIRKTKLFKADKSELSRDQKREINKFLFALSASTFSGILFSYIDRIMLGHFVAAEFIGYYTVALSFVSAASAFAGFGSALFPIFSRVNKSKLISAFKKSLKLSLIFATALTLFVAVLAYPIILIVYGKSYLPATNLLRLLSLSFFTLPISGLYTIYFTSRGKPSIIATFSIASTVLNIILNYVLITSLLKFGNSVATFGAGIALLLSQFFFIISLEILRRRDK